MRTLGEQKLRRTKRALLGPVAPFALQWAQRPPVSRAKRVVMRRLVVTGMAARRERFERTLESGLTFRGVTNDLLPLVVRIFGVWEPPLTEFMRERLCEGRTMVDVGANLGWYSLVAAPLVGDEGSVVAIEASQDLFEDLCQQILLNGLTNVRCINEAVGREEGEVVVVAGPSSHSGLTHVARNDAENRVGSAVRMRPLGAMLTPAEIAACRIVKIDVEGAEFEVARGLSGLLNEFPEDCEFVVEVGPERANSTNDVAELFQIFLDAGFRAFKLPNEYDVSAYMPPSIPSRLRMITELPQEETDVVFSRTSDESLPLFLKALD